MKLKETVRRIWRYVEALACAADYHPLAEFVACADRLEPIVACLRKKAEFSLDPAEPIESRRAGSALSSTPF